MKRLLDESQVAMSERIQVLFAAIADGAEVEFRSEVVERISELMNELTESFRPSDPLLPEK